MIPQKAADIFRDYAKNYEVSFVSAAADRDFPMSAEELSSAFECEFSRKPTIEELRAMSPDNNAEELRQEEISDYNSIYR